MGLKVFNTAMVAASADGSSPTVFTLTLDDLSTRFAEYAGAAASIKFKLTATNGGGALTTSSFVYLDSSQGSGMAASALDAVGDVATLIQTQLNALSGYSGVTVNGVATVPGDQWDFTITFPGALGVTNLAFHASSQWYPTITLVEAVSQQGANAVAGTLEVVTITASGSFDTTYDSNGNYVSLDSGGDYMSSYAAAGWTRGSFANPEVFTQDTAGAVVTTLTSGNGTVVVDVEGVTAVTGQQEIHAISAVPVYPNAGTWKPHSLVNAVVHSATSVDIEAEIDPTVAVAVTDSGSAGISDGIVTVTWDIEGDRADDELSPVNVSLTAPEITHSIT